MSKSDFVSALMIAKSLGLKTKSRINDLPEIVNEWRTRILDSDTQENHMPELDRMHWHYTSLPKETSPVLIGIPIVDFVVNVEG